MNYELQGNIIALEPISQSGIQKAGAHTMLPKMDTWYNGRSIEIPYISGNSVRGRLRRIIMKDLCHLLDDYKFGDDRVAHAFFGGGQLKSGGGDGMIDVEFRSTITALIPPVSLWAFSLGNQMIDGDLTVWNMTICCKETAWKIPERFRKNPNNSAYEFLAEQFFTRRDDNQTGKKKDEENQAIQMKVGIEVLMSGTVFHHGFIIRNPNEIKIACLHRTLNLWMENPTIGGKSSSGFGRLRLEYEEQKDDQPYLDYIESHKTEIIKYLDSVCEKFGEKAKKKKSTKPKKVEKTLEELTDDVE